MNLSLHVVSKWIRNKWADMLYVRFGFGKIRQLLGDTLCHKWITTNWFRSLNLIGTYTFDKSLVTRLWAKSIYSMVALQLRIQWVANGIIQFGECQLWTDYSLWVVHFGKVYGSRIPIAQNTQMNIEYSNLFEYFCDVREKNHNRAIDKRFIRCDSSRFIMFLFNCIFLFLRS